MSAQPFRDRYRTNLDLGHAGAAERNLWSEVLLVLINDALTGATAEVGTVAQRVRETKEARLYFTKPNRSLIDLCDLVGLDHVVVRDRMIAKIAEAPTPEELVRKHRGNAKAATLTHAGHRLTFTEWEERTGIPSAAIRSRILTGWSVADALTTPTRPANGAAVKHKAKRPRKRSAPVRAEGQAPGVGQDFGPSLGTGGGPAAQVLPNITFSECESTT